MMLWSTLPARLRASGKDDFMARSPLLLCALFAPAAVVLACSSSSGNTSAGTGGSKTTTTTSTATTTTTGTGGAGTACTDMADKMALTKNATMVGSDVLSCTLPNVGNVSAISACVQMKVGLTPACADCFAADGNCGAMSCLLMCVNGSSSPACKSCLAANCNPAFTHCSGISGQQPDGGGGGGGDGGTGDDGGDGGDGGTGDGG